MSVTDRSVRRQNYGGSPLNIRPIRESELSELLELIRAKAEFDGCPESLLATTESLRQALFSPQPAAHALVAEVEGRVIGMATYYAIFSTFIAKPGLWLDDLFVYPELRSRGIGEALIRRLSSIAKAGGCGRIDWHVSNLNERGKKFYLRIGATTSDDYRLVRLSEDRIQILADGDN